MRRFHGLRYLLPSLATWVWYRGPTGWKERTDSHKSSSDLWPWHLHAHIPHRHTWLERQGQRWRAVTSEPQSPSISHPDGNCILLSRYFCLHEEIKHWYHHRVFILEPVLSRFPALPWLTEGSLLAHFVPHVLPWTSRQNLVWHGHPLHNLVTLSACGSHIHIESQVCWCDMFILSLWLQTKTICVLERWLSG